MSTNHDNIVYFAHGKESGPWGEKITSLAEVAKAKGFAVESPDYTFTMDPDKRVERLLGLKPRASRHLVLMGSSMGGYVAAAVSAQLKPSGLFLLAPAFYRAGYAQASPKPVTTGNGLSTLIIHGWDDEIIPVEHSIRYAREHGVALHLVKSDHRLTSVLPLLGDLFSLFLDRIIQKKSC